MKFSRGEKFNEKFSESFTGKFHNFLKRRVEVFQVIKLYIGLSNSILTDGKNNSL